MILQLGVAFLDVNNKFPHLFCLHCIKWGELILFNSHCHAILRIGKGDVGLLLQLSSSTCEISCMCILALSPKVFLVSGKTSVHLEFL